MSSNHNSNNMNNNKNMNNNQDEDGFIMVKGKRKICRRHMKPLQVLEHINNLVLENSMDSTPSFEDINNVLRRLISIQKEIRATDFYKSAKNRIKETIEKYYSSEEQKLIKIVCLGLGSFCNYKASIYQLAFILEIKNHFQINDIELYDPLFSKLDKLILDKMRCKVIEENYEGKYDIDTKYITLFYLPHCSKQLTNNLLWKNWDKNKLIKLVLISNSIESLLKHFPVRLVIDDIEYIAKISNYVEEYPFNDIHYQYQYIFYPTSIHVFCKNKLKDCNDVFWSQMCNEPKYPHMEFITKELEKKFKLN